MATDRRRSGDLARSWWCLNTVGFLGRIERVWFVELWGISLMDDEDEELDREEELEE